jgi:hypothetical protein
MYCEFSEFLLIIDVSNVSSLKILFWCISLISCVCTHVNKLYLLGERRERGGFYFFGFWCSQHVPNVSYVFPT